MRARIDSHWVTHSLTLATGILVLALLLRDPVWPPTSTPQVLAWLLISFVVIVVADSRPVTIVNGRKIEPIGTTVSIAMAMTAQLPGDVVIEISAGYIALVAGLGAGVAALRRLARFGHRPVLSDIAVRVLVTTLAALLVRAPWVQGTSLMDLLVAWEDRRHTILTLALASIALLALMVQLLVWTYERAAQEHTVLRHALADELEALGTVSVGVVSTSVATALATRVVGPAAVAIFVLPLLLLILAVRRQTTVIDGQRQTVWALSRLTDQAGFTEPGHAARVARLAVPVGRRVGMSEPALRDLESAALLHDLGQLSLQRPIPGGATTHTSALDQRRVAAAGAALLTRTSELSKVSTAVAHQATPFWRMQELGDIPLASRILRVVNAYDDLVGRSTDPAVRVRALARLGLGMGYDYDPEVLRQLSRVLMREGQITRSDLDSLELWPSPTLAAQ